ncbi:hypothetical protein BDW59DRAFT_144250 [Aspergillus cavernicola]|uniref:REJ domain-containing protein n=1 Tax=Aspergillus cavernicola TaxID=176166 RepID=A0ABR4II28_9EURO
MVYGCGDDQHTTSYSCFCRASSSHFSRVISASVAHSCTSYPTSAASEALDVFNSYCILGTTPAIDSTVTSTSNPSVSLTTVSDTSSTSSSSSSSSSSYSPVRPSSGPIPSTTSGASRVRFNSLFRLLSSLYLHLAYIP